MTTGRNKKNDSRGAGSRASPAPSAATGFLARHGYGGDRLQRALARIDWSRPDARRRAQAAIAAYTDVVLALLAQGARAGRRRLPTFIAGLLNQDDPGERSWLWLALQRDAATFAALAPASRATLGAAMRPLLTHAQMLRDAAVPPARLRDLTDIDADTLLSLALREASESRATGDRPISLAGLLPLADGDDGPRAILGRLRTLRRGLAEAPVVRLDARAFRRLPATLRRPLLFTPDLTGFFLDPVAQAGARPPSPGFDPLFLDRAIDDLARGRLEHVDVDTLVLGAREHPALMRRVVDAILGGQGTLVVGDEVRERLIACATEPALCLAACAAARSVDDMRRALSQLPGLPARGTLTDALRRLARIAWCDALPAVVPPLFLATVGFRRSLAAARADALAECLETEARETHLPASLLFRHFVAWLESVSTTASRRDATLAASIARLDTAFASHGGRLAGEIDGHDLLALHRAGTAGRTLARTLAGALREYNPTRWEHGFFLRLLDADPQFALAVAGETLAARYAGDKRQAEGIP